MSNTIQIKHGENVPNNEVLQPFELGYVTSSGTLVIGDVNKNTKQLNYLSLNADGSLNLPLLLIANGAINIKSNAGYPQIVLNHVNENGTIDAKAHYCLQSSNGQAYVASYGLNATKFEAYRFPIPDTNLTDNKSYMVLTSKGGTFAGNFAFSGTITANKAIIVNSNSYGTTNPNDAGITGTVGQLYFVVTG